MKKLAIVVAALSVAAVFTACGDDSSSSSGSGKVSCTTEEMGMKTCIEATGLTSKEKDECAEMGGKLGSGCASGEDLKCENVKYEGHTGAVYMYGIPAEMKVFMNCDDLNADK